ncbi:MAG TPA: dsDNA nuclease domain-containing protein [Coriobacteriia bacterium]|nr:dsDNA nuclease domain-containing protein [Coriobacteriia bacterium]
MPEAQSASDSGGVAARRGFRFQDHYALGVMLRSAEDPFVTAVGLEIDDDISVTRVVSGSTQHEYIQVKTTDGPSLWSVPQLCCRDEGRVGTSIVEKSLDADRDIEDPSPGFRIVTTRDVNPQLRVLKLSPSDELRARHLDRIEADLVGRVGHRVSEGGRSLTDWCHRLVWDVQASERAVSLENRDLLARAALKLGYTLTPDQLDIAYQRLLAQASDLASRNCRASRVLPPQQIVDMVEEAIAIAIPHSGPRANNRLRTKMEAGEIDEALVAQAEERRRRYLEERYRPRYAPSRGYDRAIDEINTCLSDLLDNYVASTHPPSPGEFHRTCKASLQALIERLPEDCRPTYPFALGTMYETTNRCLHRFTQGEPE